MAFMLVDIRLLCTRTRLAPVCGGLLVAAMSACVRTTVPSPTAPSAARAASAYGSSSDINASFVDSAGPFRAEAADLSVTRAAGVRVRHEWGSFAVFPTFLAHVAEGEAAQEPPLTPGESALARRRLLDAFRQGGKSQYVDTTAYRDSQRTHARPDSALSYFTLAGNPVVRGDSAFVDVFNGLPQATYGPVEQQILRYWFARADGVWHFVRRQLMWAT